LCFAQCLPQPIIQCSVHPQMGQRFTFCFSSSTPMRSHGRYLRLHASLSCDVDPILIMSKSPEVESNYDNPKGRSNLEKGAEPPVQKTDPADTVQFRTTKQKSHPTQRCRLQETLHTRGQSDNTRSA
jgi:hypothetical protein